MRVVVCACLYSCLTRVPPQVLVLVTHLLRGVHVGAGGVCPNRRRRVGAVKAAPRLRPVRARGRALQQPGVCGGLSARTCRYAALTGAPVAGDAVHSSGLSAFPTNNEHATTGLLHWVRMCCAHAGVGVRGVHLSFFFWWQMGRANGSYDVEHCFQEDPVYRKTLALQRDMRYGSYERALSHIC